MLLVCFAACMLTFSLPSNIPYDKNAMIKFLYDKNSPVCELQLHLDLEQ